MDEDEEALLAAESSEESGEEEEQEQERGPQQQGDPPPEDVEEEEDLTDDEELGEDDDEEEDDLMEIVVANGEQDAGDEEGDDDEEEESSDDGGTEREAFDTDLPTRHSYLGNALEVGGRTILEEDLVQELVTFSHPGVILMPGQTMPLTIFRPQHISMMKRLIETVKTFGSLYAKLPSRHGPYEDAKIGTTAEIYEYRDPPEDTNEIGFKIKVKGRQRFRVLSTRTQIDGTRVATVEILREVKLPDPFFQVRLRSRDRMRFAPVPERATLARDDEEKEEEEEEEDDGREREAAEEAPSTVKVVNTRKRKNSLRATLGSLLSSLRRKRSPLPHNRDELKPDLPPYKMSRANNLRTRVYAPPLSAFPNWVYEMYDARILVEQVHALLGSFRLFTHARVSIPTDPEELSFWVACNLPTTDTHRYKILELDCPVQRLRYEIALMKKYQTFCCRRCKQEIATQDEIFSMSQEGPQSAYVNPGGHVHETLTLYSAKRLYLIGSPSTEFSWFPGYAWTIAQCRGCHSHMGWKFTACDPKLRPKKFWGISRQNILPLFHLKEDEGDQEEAAEAAAADDGEGEQGEGMESLLVVQ